MFIINLYKNNFFFKLEKYKILKKLKNKFIKKFNKKNIINKEFFKKRFFGI